MCVLPAKSVLAALPASLAHLVVLAEAMEEEENQRSSSSRLQQQLPRQQMQQGHLSKAARKQARKARRAAPAAKVQGLQGLEVLAALGDDEADQVDDEDNMDGGAEEHQGLAAASGEGSEEYQGDGDDVAAVAAASLSHLLCDDAELSMLRLAKELCATFPNNVEQLVDLTGGPSGAAVGRYVEDEAVSAFMHACKREGVCECLLRSQLHSFGGCPKLRTGCVLHQKCQHQKCQQGIWRVSATVL